MIQYASGLEGLNLRLLQAHEEKDAVQLANLYEQAGMILAGTGQAVAAAFFLTQAYVYSLDAGVERAGRLKSLLVSMGNEAET